MISRDTRTGGVLEAMILPALEMGRYSCTSQVEIGTRFGGGRHLVDVLAVDPFGVRFLISLKWQQTSGTAEQKVPFEAICLADAIMNSSGQYAKAYLVLGGEGWKLREFYTKGGLSQHLMYSHLVNIVSLESFVALANRAAL